MFLLQNNANIIIVGMVNSLFEPDLAECVERVKRIARRYRGNPYVEYDDLVGEGLVVLWKCWTHYNCRLNKGFWPWAIIFVRGAMMDAIRHQTHKGAYPDKPVQLPEELQSYNIWDLDSYLDLLDALQTLSPREAETILCCDLYGERIASIGRRWGVTESRVSQIHTSGKRKLRKRMAY